MEVGRDRGILVTPDGEATPVHGELLWILRTVVIKYPHDDQIIRRVLGLHQCCLQLCSLNLLAGSWRRQSRVMILSESLASCFSRLLKSTYVAKTIQQTFLSQYCTLSL